MVIEDTSIVSDAMIKMHKFIIGLTGPKASGKGVIADFLKSKGFTYFSLSDIVREEARNRGLANYTTKQLQDIGNELRLKFGNSVLADRIIEKISKSNNLLFVIDGIRNPAEVMSFKKAFNENFILISITASREKRFQFMLSRNRPSDPKTWEEFLKIDERDLGKDESPHGQQVKKCMQMADITIENNSTIQVLTQKLIKALRINRNILI